MPRKKPLPVHEIAVGVRIRFLREILGVNRTALALSAGVAMERLAAYEAGRSPLRGDVGQAVCEKLNASQIWVATGSGEMGGCFPWQPKEPAKSFRQSVLEDVEIFKTLKPRATGWGAGGESAESLLKALATSQSNFVRHILPPTLYQEYFRRVCEVDGQILNDRKEVFDKWTAYQLRDFYRSNDPEA